MIQRKTGLRLDPYFSATKIAWILDHVAGASDAAKAGRLACGTIDSWLVCKLTAGRLHVTDASNASRTLLMDIRTGDWDDELLDCFGVPRAMLPEIRSSSEVYGEVERRSPASTESRSPASPATSRRLSLARPATRPAWRRTPTAPAASCS